MFFVFSGGVVNLGCYLPCKSMAFFDCLFFPAILSGAWHFLSEDDRKFTQDLGCFGKASRLGSPSPAPPYRHVAPPRHPEHTPVRPESIAPRFSVNRLSSYATLLCLRLASCLCLALQVRADRGEDVRLRGVFGLRVVMARPQVRPVC